MNETTASAPHAVTNKIKTLLEVFDDHLCRAVQDIDLKVLNALLLHWETVMSHLKREEREICSRVLIEAW